MNPNTFSDGSALLFAIVNVVDQNGQPATLPSPPVWSTSNSAVLSPAAASDGMSATGTALIAGTVTITATSGSLSASVAVTVTAGQAVSFQITASLASALPPPAGGPPTA